MFTEGFVRLRLTTFNSMLLHINMGLPEGLCCFNFTSHLELPYTPLECVRNGSIIQPRSPHYIGLKWYTHPRSHFREERGYFFQLRMSTFSQKKGSFFKHAHFACPRFPRKGGLFLNMLISHVRGFPEKGSFFKHAHFACPRFPIKGGIFLNMLISHVHGFP